MYRKGYKMDVTHNAVVSDQLFRICGTRSSSDDAIGIAAIPAPVFLVCRNGLTLRDDAVRIAAVAASILHVGGWCRRCVDASETRMKDGAVKQGRFIAQIFSLKLDSIRLVLRA